MFGRKKVSYGSAEEKRRGTHVTDAEVERISVGRDKMCHVFSDPCGQDKHTTSLKVDPIVGKMEYKPGPPASQNW